MKHKVTLIVDIIVYIIVGLLLTAAIGSAITGKPLLFTAIRSNSMYPLLQRGDIAFVKQLKDEDEVQLGDIVIFHAEKGSLSGMGWVIHRAIERLPDGEYITKGDANELTDQAGGNPPIKREWMGSKAITIKGTPFKLPLIGYLPIWLEGLQKNPLLLPGLSGVLAVIIVVSELKNKKKKRNKSLDAQLLYIFSGLVFAVMLAFTMIATSQYFAFNYEVTADNQGVMTGSSIGVLKQGDIVEKSLSELNNKGVFPIVVSVTSRDPQVTFNRELALLERGQKLELLVTVAARNIGKYKTSVWVGMFLPLLPPSVIHFIAQKSYWLALTVIALFPALPLMLIPIIDSKTRRRTGREIMRVFKRVSRLVGL